MKTAKMVDRDTLWRNVEGTAEKYPDHAGFATVALLTSALMVLMDIRDQNEKIIATLNKANE